MYRHLHYLNTALHLFTLTQGRRIEADAAEDWDLADQLSSGEEMLFALATFFALTVHHDLVPSGLLAPDPVSPGPFDLDDFDRAAWIQIPVTGQATLRVSCLLFSYRQRCWWDGTDALARPGRRPPPVTTLYVEDKTDPLALAAAIATHLRDHLGPPENGDAAAGR
jgi:hypothetical protein